MHNYNLKINNKQFSIQVLKSSSQTAELMVNGKAYSVEIDEPNAQPLEKEGNTTSQLTLTKPKKIQETKPSASPFSTFPPPPAPKHNQEETKAILAPIPGSITEIKVKINETVKSGQVLIKMEAMKMENDICSDVDGSIKNIEISAGDSVQQGQCLIKIG